MLSMAEVESTGTIKECLEGDRLEQQSLYGQVLTCPDAAFVFWHILLAAFKAETLHNKSDECRTKAGGLVRFRFWRPPTELPTDAAAAAAVDEATFPLLAGF